MIDQKQKRKRKERKKIKQNEKIKNKPDLVVFDLFFYFYIGVV